MKKIIVLIKIPTGLLDLVYTGEKLAAHIDNEYLLIEENHRVIAQFNRNFWVFWRNEDYWDEKKQ